MQQTNLDLSKLQQLQGIHAAKNLLFQGNVLNQGQQMNTQQDMSQMVNLPLTQ